MGMYSKISEKIEIYNNLVLLYIMSDFGSVDTASEYSDNEGSQLTMNFTPRPPSTPYPSDIDFQFTRHGFSCNNAISKMMSFQKNYEPSLHPFTILQLNKDKNEYKDDMYRWKDESLHDIEEKDKTFDFESFKQSNSETNGIHVLVSPLIRTWETALLLFCQANPTATTINLYVAPFLKEKKKALIPGTHKLRRGNFPQNPRLNMKKILDFINLTEVKSLINNIRSIKIRWPKNINTNLIKDIELKVIEFTLLGDNFTLQREQLETICNGTFADINSPMLFEGTTDNNSVFLQEGNLETFMEQFHTFKDKYGNKIIINTEGVNKVFVVTHSNVMKKYIKDHYGIDIKDKKWENYKWLYKTNNWSFSDTLMQDNQIKKQNSELVNEAKTDIGSLIKLIRYKIGVPGKFEDKGTLINTKLKDEKTTCGVSDESLCTPKGGKKTKKKRKIKKTHKKKNAHKNRKTHNKRKN
jgi:hypothetical protein